MVQCVLDDVTQVKGPGLAVTVYSTEVSPPKLLDADQLKVADDEPAVTVN
jgi:hypothetical protein